MSLSPTCIARFACEIQRNYWHNFRKDADVLREKSTLKRRLNDLYVNRLVLGSGYYDNSWKTFNTLRYRYRLLNYVPNEELADMRMKKLIRAATIVASNRGNCYAFTCTFVNTRKNKNSSILKL